MFDVQYPCQIHDIGCYLLFLQKTIKLKLNFVHLFSLGKQNVRSFLWDKNDSYCDKFPKTQSIFCWDDHQVGFHLFIDMGAEA